MVMRGRFWRRMRTGLRTTIWSSRWKESVARWKEVLGRGTRWKAPMQRPEQSLSYNPVNHCSANTLFCLVAEPDYTN
ncbi:hypothetical protein CGMCC3_g10474 [Colletotrichum fructicola]|nr:uncharacterized protein CGMCC3_g10474 [Colletotrichum fructicola]KAE9573644.1 hypothetical protein CGMCC3_g10474 [Colletotrichum fructicola]